MAALTELKLPRAHQDRWSIRGLAARAVALAEDAERTGTFGVGGFLADRNGRILKEARNGVVVDGTVVDPTAHVERQLVTWYQERRQAGDRLPPPEDLLVVSSLDPCMMCTGALLNAGLSCLAVTDDPMAGVHARPGLQALPRSLHERVKRTIGFLPSHDPETRPDQIADLSGRYLSDALLERANAAFSASLDHVQDRFAPNHLGVIGARLSDRARRFVRRAGTGETQARLIGPDDTELLARDDGQSYTLVDRAVFRLIRDYTNLCREAAIEGLDLPHPRSCRIVLDRLPEEAADFVADFGAIGSFLEGAPIHRPYVCASHADADALARRQADLENFPPLYSEVIALSVGRCGSHR